MDDTDRASAMVMQAMKDCHRPGAPLPFQRIVAAQLVTSKSGDIAEVELEMFDGLSGHFECMKSGKDRDAWITHWSRLEGGDIELVDGRWRRVPVEPEPISALPQPTRVMFGSEKGDRALIVVGPNEDGTWSQSSEAHIGIHGYEDLSLDEGPTYPTEGEAWEAALVQMHRWVEGLKDTNGKPLEWFKGWLDSFARERGIKDADLRVLTARIPTPAGARSATGRRPATGSRRPHLSRSLPAGRHLDR